MLLPNQIRLRRFEFPIDICPKTDIIYMKSDIKEAVMNCESARKYAYLSAEITSLYHEAAVKIGVSDTVLDILYVLCEQEGQCLQSDIFRLTGISRQTINSAIRKLERDGLAYLKQGEGRNTLVCLTEKGRDFLLKKSAHYSRLKIRYGANGQSMSKSGIFYSHKSTGTRSKNTCMKICNRICPRPSRSSYEQRK